MVSALDVAEVQESLKFGAFGLDESRFAFRSGAESAHEHKSVLMVTGALARGGAERQMTALAQGLLRQGYHVQLFQLLELAKDQPNFNAEMAALGVRSFDPSSFANTHENARATRTSSWHLSFAPILPANIGSISHALGQAIIALRPSVIYCWSDFSNLVGGLVGIQHRVPHIVFGLRVMPPPVWFPADQAALYRAAYTLLAANPGLAFVSNSKVCAEAFEDWLPLSRGIVQVVYNGFLPQSLRTSPDMGRSQCRARLGLASNVPVIAGVMRFAEEKDPDLWLKSAALVAAARSDAQFILAGYGHDDAAERLFARANALGLANRLAMLGAIADVAEIYEASDVLLLTSRTENVPNVMIEAQAAGIPVVGTDVGGVSEAILHGETGLLVPERSAEALADAVLEILHKPDWTAQVARAGPDFVRRRFGFERMVDETIAIFEKGPLARPIAS